MRYESETGDITCSPYSQLAASSQYSSSSVASATGLDKLVEAFCQLTVHMGTGRTHQNHHGFKHHATAVGSCNSAVPLHTPFLSLYVEDWKMMQNAPLFSIKWGNTKEKSRVCFLTPSLTPVVWRIRVSSSTCPHSSKTEYLVTMWPFGWESSFSQKGLHTLWNLSFR